jgi:protein-tyrosine kinase
VSLIESALDKLRRSGGSSSGITPRATGTRAFVAATGLAPAAVTATSRPVASKQIALDLAALRAAGYLPEASCERLFADQYRHIKRPLIEKAMSAGGSADLRLLMVTSALPGDGKTFTSINLALSMARERDISVLLIDADVPKPNISRILGLEQEAGLLDALTDESIDVDSLILRTDVPGLDILPVGRPVDSAPELLASARMAQIARRFCARDPSCIALFDTPPMLLSSEARALQQILGQIVLVVRAGKTPQRGVLDALGEIDQGKLSGLILNDSWASPTSGYYGYGSYGSEGAERAAAG